jgi:hypothetical protein
MAIFRSKQARFAKPEQVVAVVTDVSLGGEKRLQGCHCEGRTS